MKNGSIEENKIVVYIAVAFVVVFAFIITTYLLLFYKNGTNENNKSASKPTIEEPVKDLNGYLASPDSDSYGLEEEILNKLAPRKDFLNDDEGNVILSEDVANGLSQPIQ